MKLEKNISILKNEIDLNKSIKNLTYENVTINLHPEVSCEIILNVARSSEEASTQKKLGKAITSNSENEDNKNEVSKTDTSEEPSTQNEMLTDDKKDTKTNADDLKVLHKEANVSDTPKNEKEVKATEIDN